MAESLDNVSLVNLAAGVGVQSRSGEDDAAKPSCSARPRQFDGILKSFLADEKAASAKRPRQKPQSGGKQLPTGVKQWKMHGNKLAGDPARMSGVDRQSLREAIDKTVPADQVEGEYGLADLPPEIAEAAAEAATLILGLLFPEQAGFTQPVSGFESLLPESGQGDALAVLSRLVEQLNPDASGEGTPGWSGVQLDSESAETLADALETANASAEMNIDAVLSSLEQLLEGMPRPVLENALAKAAEQMGLAAPGEGKAWFAEIAEALDIELVSLEEMPGPVTPDRLLSELHSSIQHSGDAALLQAMGMDAKTHNAAPVENSPPEIAGSLQQQAAEAAGSGGTDTSGQVAEEAGPALEMPETEQAEAPAQPAQAAQAATRTHAPDTELPVEYTGTQNAENELFNQFKQFLSEKAAETSGERPIKSMEELETPDSEAAMQLLDEFVEWLDQETLSENAAAMAETPEQLGQALANAADRELQPVQTRHVGEEATHWTAKLIQALTGMQTNAGQSAGASAITEAVAQPGTIQVTTGSTATPAPQNTATGSTGATGGLPMPEAGATVDSARADAGGHNSNNQMATPMAPNPTTAPSNATPSTPTSVSSMLEQLENIERLTEAMKMANKNGVKNLTMVLSPPELGKVMLNVQSRAGVVSAFIRVEKPEAAAQLGANLQQLRENLKAQGIELGELEIRQQNHGQTGGFGEGRRGHHQGETDRTGHANRSGLAEDGNATEENETPASSRSSDQGGLNLFA